MKIGIDIDDTIANTHDILFSYAQKYTAEDLNNVRYDLSGDYILMSDIDISDSDYALEFKTLGCFSGTFDGNGKVIKNIYIITKFILL